MELRAKTFAFPVLAPHDVNMRPTHERAERPTLAARREPVMKPLKVQHADLCQRPRGARRGRHSEGQQSRLSSSPSSLVASIKEHLRLVNDHSSSEDNSGERAHAAAVSSCV
eukprot:2985159-Rhodomonas_salina.1